MIKKYFSILSFPEQTFQWMMENDDGKHQKRTDIIIFLTAITPFIFVFIYDFIFPYDPNSAEVPLSMRIIGLVIPIVFGTLIGFMILKYLIPFLINAVGQKLSDDASNIDQTRFVFAFSLLPMLLIAPLKGMYFIDKGILLYIILAIQIIAGLNSLYVLHTGVKMIHGFNNLKGIITISPYILLSFAAYFIY